MLTGLRERQSSSISCSEHAPAPGRGKTPGDEPTLANVHLRLIRVVSGVRQRDSQCAHIATSAALESCAPPGPSRRRVGVAPHDSTLGPSHTLGFHGRVPLFAGLDGVHGFIDGSCCALRGCFRFVDGGAIFAVFIARGVSISASMESSSGVSHGAPCLILPRM